MKPNSFSLSGLSGYIFALAATLVLAACGDLPRPFESTVADRQANEILEPPDAGGVLVLPVDGTDTRLAEALAISLRDAGTPAFVESANADSHIIGAWTEVAPAAGDNVAVTLHWELARPKGEMITSRLREMLVPAETWRDGSAEQLAAVFRPDAEHIVRRIEGRVQTTERPMRGGVPLPRRRPQAFAQPASALAPSRTVQLPADVLDVSSIMGETPADTQTASRPSVGESAAGADGMSKDAGTGREPTALPDLRVGVAEAASAPADAAEALPRAMRDRLRANGFVVLPVESLGPGDIVMRPSVSVTPVEGGMVRAAVSWDVVEVLEGGKVSQLGVVDQENLVPEGTLQGAWSEAAPVVAEAAVPAVLNLLRDVGAIAAATGGEPAASAE